MDKRMEKVLDQPVMSVADFAKVMGLSLGAAYVFIDRGEVKVIRFGRRIVIPTNYVRELLGLPP